MLVPLSRLDYYIAESILAIQRGRAHCAAQVVPVDTEPPQAVNFTFDVIDDTKPAIFGDESQSVQPETTQLQTTDDTSTSTTTQRAVTTEETQTQTPGEERTRQSFGRSTDTETSETTT